MHRRSPKCAADKDKQVYFPGFIHNSPPSVERTVNFPSFPQICRSADAARQTAGGWMDEWPELDGCWLLSSLVVVGGTRRSPRLASPRSVSCCLRADECQSPWFSHRPKDSMSFLVRTSRCMGFSLNCDPVDVWSRIGWLWWDMANSISLISALK